MNSSIIELEQQALYNDDYDEVPPSDIIAFNELRSCADLYRMYEQGILDIHPDFQREIVWKDPDQSRFVDSLIKQLPIPSMCFALDHKQQKWIVIDGLQRMSTIIRFLKGDDWKISKLDDIDPGLKGQSVAAIKNSNTSLHNYYTRVENLTVPITVLRCDFRKKTHLDYLFTIFHRLNTGGMKLNNQEIRNCIYDGSLNKLLKELDKRPMWRRINKMKPNDSYRFTKQELILRFFALVENLNSYEGRLAKFLNKYMHDHQYEQTDWIEKKITLFENTARVINESILEQSTPPKLTITVLESLLVGVGSNIEKCMNASPAQLKQNFQAMRDDPEFSEVLLREGLSGKQRVINRIKASVRSFSV